MSTHVTWSIVTTSGDETELLARAIGRSLRGGEVVELVSDLGGGKTTFTRGLVEGVGSKDIVASPTFTVSKVYAAGKLEVHHFDFYRLQEPGIVAMELAEVIGDPHAIVVVEWADVVQHVLPEARLRIAIEQTAEGSRRLTLRYPVSLQYMMEAVKT